MNSSISVIGGSDGPTSIFLAGKIGTNWLNIFGLIIVALLLIPNIIYFLLIIFAVIFGIGHIYVTKKNRVE